MLHCRRALFVLLCSCFGEAVGDDRPVLDVPDLVVVCPNCDELPLRERVVRDARLIEGESREADLDELTALMVAMFDRTLAVDRRAAAASELREIASGLPLDVGGQSARRMILRRVELVEAVLAGRREFALSDDIAELGEDVAVRAAIDSEFGARELHGDIVRDQLEALAEVSPNAHAELAPLVQRHYGDFNLRVCLSESMVAKIIQRVNRQGKGINRCVLGARVTGQQSTTTNIASDIQPSSETARWLITGEGKTSTNTVGRRNPVTVKTLGEYDFALRRQMDFADGQIGYEKPTISVDSNSRTIGMTTKYDRVPLFRRFVRKRAAAEVARKRPIAERQTAERVGGNALAQFQTNTAKSFDELNERLRRYINYRKRTLGRGPEFGSHSTDTHLFLRTRTVSRSHLTGSPPIVMPKPTTSMVVQVHESFINASLDSLTVMAQRRANEFVAKLNESGFLEREVEGTVAELRDALRSNDVIDELREMEPFVASDLLDVLTSILPNVTLQMVEDRLETLEPLLNGAIRSGLLSELPQVDFDDCDPVRVRFDANTINLVFMAGPRRDEPEPWTVSMTPIVDDGALTLHLATTPEREATEAFLRVLTPIFGRLVEQVPQQIEGLQQPRRPDDLVDLPDHLSYRFENVELCDGWLTMEIDADVKE